MQIAKVQTKIGQITFKQISDTRFVVRCKGLPVMKIKQDRETGYWEGTAKCINKYGVETIAMGRSAKQCYRNAVATFWA